MSVNRMDLGGQCLSTAPGYVTREVYIVVIEEDPVRYFAGVSATGRPKLSEDVWDAIWLRRDQTDEVLEMLKSPRAEVVGYNLELRRI